jgi:sugar fermentation stimulation protein A
LLYTYPQLHQGKLLRRYKRFFADVELDTGEIVIAHCPNTGPMTGVCEIGAPVQLSYHDNPQRKLAYTWEMIWVDDIWVGINTGLPNKLIKLALEKRLFPQLEYDTVRSEVRYGADNRSRVDFLLTGGTKPIYLEVKNTTWTIEDMAVFPDTETTRGQKHLRELTALMPESRAVMLYLINRGDLTKFAPGDTRDPLYGELFRVGIDRGLEVLPCRFNVSPIGVEYLGLADLVLN